MGLVDIKIDPKDIQKVQSDAQSDLVDQFLLVMESQSWDFHTKQDIRHILNRLIKRA